MKCYKCGAESSSKFCPECGSDLSAQMNQPPVSAPTPPPPYNNWSNTVPNTPPKHSGLSIAAFVVSFLGCLGFIGTILGIVDLANAKKETTVRKHGLSIAAIVIGIVFTIFGFMIRGTSSNRDRANHEAANRQYESVVEDENDSNSAATTSATTASTTVDYTAGMDLSTANAFNSAMNYLDMMAFSREGLIDQLSSSYGEGYTMQQATDAIDALEEYGLVDWNEEAVRSAENYLDMMAFSRQGLIDQLSADYGEQFTVDQATYAMDYLEENNLVDWNEQAVRSAENYLDMMSFSRQSLIDQLSSDYGEQFTVEQATYAADQVGLT